MSRTDELERAAIQKDLDCAREVAGRALVVAKRKMIEFQVKYHELRDNVERAYNDPKELYKLGGEWGVH